MKPRYLWRVVTDGPAHPGPHLVLTVICPQASGRPGKFSLFHALGSLEQHRHHSTQRLALAVGCGALLGRLAEFPTLQYLMRSPE